MVLVGLSGNNYQLDVKPFSSGGEGDIYGLIGDTDKVVKLYHPDRITEELEQKLLVMSRRPPDAKVLSQVAWPLDVVYSNGSFAGFVMPRLNITDELSSIYVYPPKKDISFKAKLVIAQNICAVISDVHKAGFVFGDFNPKNIGIDINTCRVAFLDTDSYHITEGNITYRCKVCLDGYVAPELLKKCEAYKSDAYASAPLPTFTQDTDNFALAIHIFKLLMNGFTPFNGIKETESASSASPGNGNQAIKHDNYCFKPGNKPQASATPPLDSLPREIADLFTRAFMYGRLDPKLRPIATEWYKALLNFENDLIQCKINPRTHYYKRSLNSCPWCEADQRYAKVMGSSFSQKVYTGAIPVVPPNTQSNTTVGTASVTQQSSQTHTVNSSYSQPARVSSSSAKTANKTNKNRKIAAIAIVAAFAVVLLSNLLSNKPSQNRSISTVSHSSASYSTDTGSTNLNGVAAENKESSNQRNSNSDSQTKSVASAVPTIDSGFEVEDNNSAANANQIHINKKYSGSLSDEFNVEKDWYAFTLQEESIINATFYSKSQINDELYWDINIRSKETPQEYIWQTFVRGSETTTTSKDLYLPAGDYFFEVESSDMHSVEQYSFEITTKALKSSNVAAIADGLFEAHIIEPASQAVVGAQIVSWNGTFTDKGEIDTYSFSTDRDGIYCLYFTDILEGQKYAIQLVNEAGNAIANPYLYSAYGLDEGLEIELKSNNRYTVNVSQFDEYKGSYCLNLGQQKDISDVSKLTSIKDSFEFIHQQNMYKYIPTFTGEYSFSFSDIPEGYEYGIQILNSAGEPLTNPYWYSTYQNDEAQTITLSAGHTYTIKARQTNNYYGTYSLNIGFYKDNGEIGDKYSVNDSVQFICQRNIYRFTPNLSADYEIGISNVPEGVKYYIQVRNSADQPISNPYWYSSYGNWDSQTVTLSAGQEYIIIIRPESKNYGDYTLCIGNYKGPTDISALDSISDNMQYLLQRNTYLFIPEKEGTYEFKLSGLPSGNKYGIQILNYAKQAITNPYWYSTYGSGDKQEVSLKSGEQYTIVIRQLSAYLGDYSLSIRRK